jgi:hypothetical protein
MIVSVFVSISIDHYRSDTSSVDPYLAPEAYVFISSDYIAQVVRHHACFDPLCLQLFFQISIADESCQIYCKI